MSEGAKELLKSLVKNPISRRSLFGLAAVSAFASTPLGKAFGVSTPVITQVLGRPTNTSIAVNVMATEPVTAVIEYGYTKTR